MFTKTYRVHQIFRRANRGLVKSKVNSNTHHLPLSLFKSQITVRDSVFLYFSVTKGQAASDDDLGTVTDRYSDIYSMGSDRSNGQENH